jgi:hypothetical protein
MEMPNHLEAFENVKPQIGACGIWCGSCVVGNGTLKELSARYAQLLEDYGLEEWGPKDFNFGELRKGLRSLQEVPVCLGCRRGGGRESCEIRACAVDRETGFCGECSAHGTCIHHELLEHMRTGAARAGLVVEASPEDPSREIEAWTEDLCESWPGCTLFVRYP